MRIEVNLWLSAAILYGPDNRLVCIVPFKDLAKEGIFVR